MNSNAHILFGQTLSFSQDPFVEGVAAGRHETHGAVVIEDGLITATGPADQVQAPQNAIPHHYGNALIMAGFVDAHVHYPQTAIIASWGKRLIDWLNSYTFPEETRLSDPDYAAVIASRYFDLALAHGTTTMASYATSDPVSVDAFFSEAKSRKLRALTGKTCMDRNAPETLKDTAQTAYDDSKALLDRWHGQDRLSYIITPRFSPTSSPEQLSALGALWSEHPDCLMQTHISEQIEEISWVRELYPTARDYLDTYEMHGLLGPCLLYTSPSPRDRTRSRMPSSA